MDATGKIAAAAPDLPPVAAAAPTTIRVNDLIPRHLLPEHARIEAEVDDELFERRQARNRWLFTADEVDRFDARDALRESRAEQEAADWCSDLEQDLRSHQEER